MVANYLDSNIKHNMRKKMDFTCEFHMGEPGLNQGKHIEKTFSENVQNTCLFLLCEYFFPSFINFCKANQMGFMKRFSPKCLPPVVKVLRCFMT